MCWLGYLYLSLIYDQRPCIGCCSRSFRPLNQQLQRSLHEYPRPVQMCTTHKQTAREAYCTLATARDAASRSPCQAKQRRNSLTLWHRCVQVQQNRLNGPLDNSQLLPSFRDLAPANGHCRSKAAMLIMRAKYSGHANAFRVICHHMFSSLRSRSGKQFVRT